MFDESCVEFDEGAEIIENLVEGGSALGVEEPLEHFSRPSGRVPDKVDDLGAQLERRTVSATSDKAFSVGIVPGRGLGVECSGEPVL